jgi:flagellar basal body-associated protein FliL
MRRTRLLVVLVVVLALAGLVYYFYVGSAAPPGQRSLISVNESNFDQLRRDFNDAQGAARVIALLSPT